MAKEELIHQQLTLIPKLLDSPTPLLRRLDEFTYNAGPPSYPAIFHPEEVGYSVSVPDLEGCFSEGDTLEEAIAMTQDVIQLCLEDYSIYPTPSDPEELPLEPGDLVKLISLDGQAFHL